MGLQERKVLPPDAPVPAGAADAGTAPPADRVERLAASGGAVLVTLETDAREPDPGLLAAASVYAWLGATLFRVPESQADGTRQVLDMVASIQGTRPPAVARRGLA
ncbi:hypothetical protein [Actinomadura madurae]|uniref:hypothetical protein n=1 Tax=Actinomadura madurae TaxID=1993 RepID=UPI002026EC99|nr:hypothetical protein [Actinomadura madurae]MCP9953924.1 hypothetical protein [Actinomadura madurae]MCP9970671.1 hypothetical protein [Actinomadura madurae]MCQ0005297.1 hypothetical protein [Actinomadura madurae]MCQ0019388.1 hypothetical protein [Actinomadura madurae]URM99403.1 hypothetical protein LUW76_36625 [Actinomadura madurae]